MDAEYRCRGGRDKCVARTSDGAAITVKPDTLCARCVEDIQRALDQLQPLREILYLSIGGSMKVSYESKVSRTSEPQAPMNVHIDAMLGDIDLAMERTYGLPIRDLITRPAEEAEVWVKGRPRKMFLDGVTRALDIRRVHAKAMDMTGLAPKWERRVAPCPQCSMPTLGAWSGSDTIHCRNDDCLAQFTKDEYEAYCFAESKKK